MTIVRVYGMINGKESFPFLNKGDQYYFQLPDTLTGKFVCEFWAEDEYGNIGYNAALLTLVRGVIKCVEVLTKEYKTTMRGDPYRIRMDMDGFKVMEGLQPLLSLHTDEYKVRMIPPTCRRDMMEAI